ncbi:MAG TPA: biosynthetic peptidoglycan transglycosylase, partial [Actinomycetota bacterium]
MASSHRIAHNENRSATAAVADGGLRLLLLAAVIGIGAVLFALALLPTVGAAGKTVQRFSDELNRIGGDVDLTFPRLPLRSTIYAADGKTVLATVYLDENRKVVRLGRMGDFVKLAILAVEDARYYDHPGLDLQGILRALVANISSGEIEQGASTITQQLARNVFPEIGTERTVARKLAEAKVAIRMEEEYSKDEILEIYLNEVYFGAGVYGIGTAAEYYFGKQPKDLTLGEAAMLAGLVASPNEFSPVNDKDAALER